PPIRPADIRPGDPTISTTRTTSASTRPAGPSAIPPAGGWSARRPTCSPRCPPPWPRKGRPATSCTSSAAGGARPISGHSPNGRGRLPVPGGIHGEGGDSRTVARRRVAGRGNPGPPRDAVGGSPGARKGRRLMAPTRPDPLAVAETDRIAALLAEVSGRPVPRP